MSEDSINELAGRTVGKGALLFIVNVDWFFLSHRLAIAKAAREAGYKVHIACRSTGRANELRAEGFLVHEIRMDRGSIALGVQIAAITDIVAIIRQIRPQIVHCITIKPILLGGGVARLLGVPMVIAAVSGLGYVFISKGWIATIRRSIIGLFYRFALSGKRTRVIFQNDDDRRVISQIAAIDPAHVRMIGGSGVDLKRFRFSSLPDGRTTVAFAARLLIDKGVREFVAAAKSVIESGIDARFVVAGSLDPDNPACIPATELSQWVAEGKVEFAGQIDDMPKFYAAAHIVVLPSYREGMPLGLLEAAAVGRAIVTTDVPGCRDAIEAGETGILVPVRNSDQLAAAITRLIQDPALCAEMGRKGSIRAAEKFSIESVVEQHLEIYTEAAV